MRVISNRSSGKMGLALARALSLRGASVKLVYASINQEIPYYLSDAFSAFCSRNEGRHRAIGGGMRLDL
jgi:phosphopantothenoylcysteine decarboxylase/phosphopantothenate--cysteine ligase